MLESAGTIDELSAPLAQELKANGIAPEYADAIAPLLAAEFATFVAPRSQPGTLSLLLGNYAIRKDDIKLFDAFTNALQAAAGVAFFMARQPVLAANVAIGISLARLLHTLAMRGTFLDSEALHVLTILRCNVPSLDAPGLSPADVLAIVQRTRPEADLAWVQHRLDFLRQVPTQDGSDVKVASEDGFGRWRSHA